MLLRGKVVVMPEVLSRDINGSVTTEPRQGGEEDDGMDTGHCTEP